LGVAGFKLIPLIEGKPIFAQSVEPGTLGSLEHQFASPDEQAWPWTYWYGMNGNLSREGITADLESMHRVGIRGVLYMEVAILFPEGPVRSLTPEWHDLMQHAMREADRLGIRWNMNNDGGWAGSGGPWITPELSMQMVVWSETTVEGPNTVSTMLSQPKATRGYYKDIAVLAFPTPPGDSKRMADFSPLLTYGQERKEFDFSKLIDGNPGTVTPLPRPPAGQPLYVNLDFSEPFTAQSVSVALDAWNSGMSTVSGEVQISDNGKDYRTIRKMNIYWPNSSANFQQVSSRHYRILIHYVESGDFSGADKTGIPLGEIQLHEGPRIEDIPGKALYLRQDAYSVGSDALSSEPPFPEDTTIRSRQILDVSKKMDTSGLLKWDVPPGKWTVIRFGYTSTGAENAPSTKELLGLECDKLSKKAIEVQFDGLVGKLLQDEATAGVKVVTMSHIDSWEVGSQNWTLDFREQFQTRRGYDPVPYLPILTGRAIEGAEQSERFLWDLRRTIADLLLENYADHLKEICHQHGLTLSIEGYGAGPLDELAYGGQADVPMGEFWTGDGIYAKTFNICNKAMASSGHVYGRPIIQAEAFTSDFAYAKYAAHPFQFKPLGDLAFTWGINRMVLSEFIMQPWKDRKPGLTLGPWGSHINRGNTWWNQSQSWNTYMARCQALLQSGTFMADVAYLGSENAPYRAPYRADLDPPLPPGYDFDFLPPQVLLKDATVHEGRIHLASGMSYRLLVLQPGRSMTPALLRKIQQLVKDGATVVGPRPANSPGLSNFPQCDAEVQKMAEELWGECDGSSIQENRFGEGKIIWGRAIGDILAGLETPTAFDCDEAAVGEEIRFIHRNVHGDDFFFVASGVPEARKFLCTFRVSGEGKTPELWWPDSGRIEPISVFNEYAPFVRPTAANRVSATRVAVPISLDPYGSVFVVFRTSAGPRADHIISIQRDGAAVYGLAPVLQNRMNTTDVKRVDDKGFVIETVDEGTYDFATAAGHLLKAEVPQLPNPISIQGPWRLEFPRDLGAPDHVILDRLISWTNHPDPGVKYFSGTATYRSRFKLREGMLRPDRRLCLDLGRVCVIAEVVLNGKDIGILWKPPFMVDITDFVSGGDNTLEVRVVNLWPNRLIGDEHLPEDCVWAEPSTARDPMPKTMGVVIDKWPEWLLENKPRPTKRVAFPTWKKWGKDDPLLESGLIGPVRIFAKSNVRLTR
jgi:hypothetical protein